MARSRATAGLAEKQRTGDIVLRNRRQTSHFDKKSTDIKKPVEAEGSYKGRGRAAQTRCCKNERSALEFGVNARFVMATVKEASLDQPVKCLFDDAGVHRPSCYWKAANFTKQDFRLKKRATSKTFKEKCSLLLSAKQSLVYLV